MMRKREREREVEAGGEAEWCKSGERGKVR